MLSAALLLFANTLLFSLRLSGGGSFPKPLSAAEEREWLARYAQGDPEARNVLIERNLRLVAHIINNGASQRKDFVERGTSCVPAAGQNGWHLLEDNSINPLYLWGICSILSNVSAFMMLHYKHIYATQ